MRALNGVDRPADRLVCFPHSGGTAATYHPWAPAVPPDCHLLAVQYPGHADRIAEPFAESVADIAAHVAAELAALGTTRCTLFGHSLGALVAYETARVLQDGGLPVRALLVSGAPEPELAGGGRTHRLGDDELWSLLRELGGIDPDVTESPELRELVLPVLRADIALNETYRPTARPEPLHCEVRAYHHTEDPLVDRAEIDGWSAVSTGRFSIRSRPGGHFRLFSDPAELVADVVTTLREAEVHR